jgi:hypothetical protein
MMSGGAGAIPVLLLMIELPEFGSAIDKRKELISNTRCQIPDSRLEPGVLNLGSGVFEIQSSSGIWNLESGICNPESGIWYL